MKETPRLGLLCTPRGHRTDTLVMAFGEQLPRKRRVGMLSSCPFAQRAPGTTTSRAAAKSSGKEERQWAWVGRDPGTGQRRDAWGRRSLSPQ